MFTVNEDKPWHLTPTKGCKSFMVKNIISISTKASDTSRSTSAQ